MCEQLCFSLLLLHKKHWSHNRLLSLLHPTGARTSSSALTYIVLKVAHYGLISNGNFPNWGKAAESESNVSLMKLMVENGEEVGGHLTTLDTTEHAQRGMSVY